MQEQSFKNHARFVPGFHFVTTGVIVLALIVSIIIMVQAGITMSSVFNILVVICLGLLFAFIRIFATGNQDRIIRAEENFRYYRLTGKMPDERLTKSQLIALRFAGDDEFVALCDKAVKENMTSSQIKQAIAQWRADHHRV